MPYKFRNPGPWGGGSLEDLDAIDVDNNFWQAIQDIRAKAAQGVGISNIVVSGSQFTVVLTDHTLLGPYQLPVAKIIFKGEWLPNYAYPGSSIITHGGSTYFIPVNHVSEATFDPGANDGHGQNFYELLLQNPALTIPDSGAIGSVLTMVAAGVWNWVPPGAVQTTIDTTSSTTIHPVIADAGTYFRCTSTSAVLVVIPLNATVAFPVGTALKFRQDNTGVVTLTGEGSVILNSIDGFMPETSRMGAVIEAIKVGNDEWDVFGFLMAHP